MSGALIIGGGGMVGQKLAHRLAAERPDLSVTLYDLGFPQQGAPAASRLTANIADAGEAARIAALRPDPIFHLAAIVSGEAEADFDKGWRVNADSFRMFLEAIRAEHVASGGTYRPRVVFTSSIAVFGPPFPDKIGDDFILSPQTSYGAQKALAELMLQDFSRKGFVDGLSLRLPTICVRPGKPNKAASSFFSGIIREPLDGKEAILPVSRDVRHWHASPRSAAGFLAHAATLDTERLNGRRALNLPGVTCTVDEQIEALRDAAGSDVVALIREEPDDTIIRIVGSWPRDFAPDRALALGFKAEETFREIVDVYMAEDRPTT
ncbi:MAG: D-erythronate dehydrogenase [Pseudomonadota bacterium]